jgi:SAM-dependent methyltransferase
LIERTYDPRTISGLEQLGIGAGWRCLDVGAGGGSIARWLRDRVTPGGSVVAVDLDTRFFDNEAGIEARRLDILADELERSEYDLVHCRCLLHHLRGRQARATERMVGAIRNGGVLLATEPYFGAMLDSPTPAVASAWRAFCAALPNADYAWAPGLPSTLTTAGLSDVEAVAHADFVRGGTSEAELLRLSFEAVRDRIPASVDLDAAIERLRDPAALEPGVVWYSAWGKRHGARQSP